jgi:hypothetical protein
LTVVLLNWWFSEKSTPPLNESSRRPRETAVSAPAAWFSKLESLRLKRR